MNEQISKTKFDWDKPQEKTEYPDSVEWDQEGKTIEGTVWRIEDVGEGRILAEIDDKDIGRCTVWLATVLHNQFRRQKIEEGSYVGIRYIGDKTSKNGTYKNFDVRVL